MTPSPPDTIPSQKTAHGLLAHAGRYTPEKYAEAKATFVAAQLKRRILDALAETETPLSAAHRQELADLLTGGEPR